MQNSSRSRRIAHEFSGADHTKGALIPIPFRFLFVSLVSLAIVTNMPSRASSSGRLCYHRYVKSSQSPDKTHQTKMISYLLICIKPCFHKPSEPSQMVKNGQGRRSSNETLPIEPPSQSSYPRHTFHPPHLQLGHHHQIGLATPFVSPP